MLRIASRPDFICLHMPLTVTENMPGLIQGADPHWLTAEASDLFNSLPVGKPAVFVRKFIKTCQQSPGGTPAQKDTISVAYEQDGPMIHPPLFCCRHDRQRRCPAFMKSPAERTQGTGGGICPACRSRSRHTDTGSQVHQRLIEIPRSVVGHDPEKKAVSGFSCSRRVDLLFIQGEAGKNTKQIAVYGRDFLSESDRGDRRGCIRSDTGQFSQFRSLAGHLTAIQGHDLPCRLFQISCSAVIAQTLP